MINNDATNKISKGTTAVEPVSRMWKVTYSFVDDASNLRSGSLVVSQETEKQAKDEAFSILTGRNLRGVKITKTVQY